MKRKLLIPIIAALLLAPWPVAYAYDEAKAANIPIITTPAPSLAPQINAFGNAIGSVSPGEIFRVDASNIAVDTSYTIYLVNIDELARCYRYMTLNIGIYVQTDIDRWDKVTTVAGETPPPIYLTMQNGMASFILPGNAKYKITIEKGCFYCYGATSNGSAAIPEFYLTVS